MTPAEMKAWFCGDWDYGAGIVSASTRGRARSCWAGEYGLEFYECLGLPVRRCPELDDEARRLGPGDITYDADRTRVMAAGICWGSCPGSDPCLCPACTSEEEFR